MLTFTNNVKISNVNLKSNEPKYEQVSWTGQSIQRLTGIQYYEIEFALNFNIKDRAEVQAFIGEYGQGKTFDISLGHLSSYTGLETGAVASTSNISAGSIVIPTNNQVLSLGTLIQFANHKKIYRIIDRGNTSLTIFPSLRSGVQNGEMITYNGIILRAMLDADNDFSMPITNIVQMKFTAREKF